MGAQIKERNMNEVKEEIQGIDLDSILDKLRNDNEDVWFDLELPSNGVPYPKEVQIKEMKTKHQKKLLKELFANKDKAFSNLLSECVKCDTKIEDMTPFDQEFLLLELSCITFPEPQVYTQQLDDGSSIDITIDKKELKLNKVDDGTEYPFKKELSKSGLTFYLNFNSSKKTEKVNDHAQHYKGDIMKRSLIDIAMCTEKVTYKDQIVAAKSWLDYLSLLETLKTSDNAEIIDYHDEISNKYGYKLKKEVYNPNTMTTMELDLDPLNFFRLVI